MFFRRPDSNAKTSVEAPGERVCRLLYTSVAVIGESVEEVSGHCAAILTASRRNNAAAGVTGALMVCDHRFVQVLEGPESAVHATLERIRRDPRHCQTQVLSSDPATKRLFSAWAMALVGAQDGQAVSLSQTATLQTAIGNPANGGPKLIALMCDLARGAPELRGAAADFAA